MLLNSYLAYQWQITIHTRIPLFINGYHLVRARLLVINYHDYLVVGSDLLFLRRLKIELVDCRKQVRGDLSSF